MAQNEGHNARILELDDLLREDEDVKRRTTNESGESLTGWYSRLLSTLALVTDGHKIMYAQMRVQPDGSEGRFVVFTDRVAIVGDIEDVYNPNEDVMVRTLPRQAIRALRVRAGDRHDEQSSRAMGWPGHLIVSALYDGELDVVSVGGQSFSRTEPGNKGAIWTLLDSLREDLDRK